jgi:hypothetical protein
MCRFKNTYFVFLLALVAPSAYSETSPYPEPFSAVTVKDYLASCKIHSDTCALEVGNALMDKIDFRGASQVCLNSGYDAHAILDWLISHPETHRMPTEDGIYLAMRSLYPCR